jgi:hypothetical protein
MAFSFAFLVVAFVCPVVIPEGNLRLPLAFTGRKPLV